ncbi:toxin-antitoxin system, toxin component, HicA family protein [Lachnospiraceae bacterium PAL113]|uniref:Toxin-antitoxin system, toxin component, HicA family protein n=1 Tax=Aequitasia blattaphilus TaxID=2949332 RepID=A0ABT1EBI0_9FIRM|nr:toxin-antitoxin system, toxin component, HicA family protein [Aequitasia blattaphilus]MCR8614512.1 toxin-antitoxin system, toxin component, HicA family protein [Aequitasia blattaphilus]
MKLSGESFTKRLEEGGYVFLRHGAEHDIYSKGKDKIPVLRHKEINERLARNELKKRGL